MLGFCIGVFCVWLTMDSLYLLGGVLIVPSSSFMRSCMAGFQLYLVSRMTPRYSPFNSVVCWCTISLMHRCVSVFSIFGFPTLEVGLTLRKNDFDGEQLPPLATMKMCTVICIHTHGRVHIHTHVYVSYLLVFLILI